MSNDVEQNDRRAAYIATAGQRVFDIDFPIESAADVAVYQNGGLITAYVVDVAALRITLDTGTADQDSIVIEGSTAQVRTSSFPILGKLRASALNFDFRRIYYILQELVRDGSRAVQLNKSEAAGVSGALPVRDQGKVLVWGTQGLENSSTDISVLDSAVTEVSDLKDQTEGFKNDAETAEQNAQGAQSLSEAARDTAQDWAVKTDGHVAAGEYSAKAYAVGGTGTETNNARYWKEQAELIAGPASTDPLPAATPDADDDLPFGDKSDSNLAKRASIQDVVKAALLDEDDMASDSADQAPTQQSVSAYVQAVVNALDFGGRVPLVTQTVVNPVMSVVFDDQIDDSYDFYEIVWDGVATESAASQLGLQTGNDGVFDSSSGDYFTAALAALSSSASLTVNNQQSFSRISLTGGINQQIGSTSFCSGRVLIFSAAAARFTRFIYESSFRDTGGAECFASGQGTRTETAVHDRVRFLFEVGNITAGTFTLYGFKEAA